MTVSGGPEAADVPDVTDMPREEAVAQLEDAGFVPEYVDSEDKQRVERGIVTRTQPAAGTAAQRGDTVQIWDATGSFRVPDVRRTDIESATEILEDIGFTVDVTERPDGENAAGTVLEQSPQGDTSATIGSEISLIVAAPEGPVSVPNVTGQPLADAQNTLAEAGFGHTDSTESSDSVAEGRVIRTEPGANDDVDSGFDDSHRGLLRGRSRPPPRSRASRVSRPSRRPRNRNRNPPRRARPPRTRRAMSPATATATTEQLGDEETARGTAMGTTERTTAPADRSSAARILVVDNYDSFVFTIVGYLQQLGAETVVVRNDEVPESPSGEVDLSGFDGVLISPGPGNPTTAGRSLRGHRGPAPRVSCRCWACAWAIRHWASTSAPPWTMPRS